VLPTHALTMKQGERWCRSGTACWQGPVLLLRSSLTGVPGDKVMLSHLVLEDLQMPTSSGIQIFCGGKERVGITK